MSRKKHTILLCIVAVLVIAGWVWRYITMNAYYDALSDFEGTEYYEIGDIVPFGESYINKINMDGYSIRVDGFSIMDADSYIETLPDFTPDQYFHQPDKVAVVEITLFNEDSEVEGLSLTDLSTLYGFDSLAHLNWDLLVGANPILEDGMMIGIRLAPGSQYSLVLPYNLEKFSFNGSTWRNIGNYEFFFPVVGNPVEKVVRLN